MTDQTHPPTVPTNDKVADLLAALEASITAAKEERARVRAARGAR